MTFAQAMVPPPPPPRPQKASAGVPARRPPPPPPPPKTKPPPPPPRSRPPPPPPPRPNQQQVKKTPSPKPPPGRPPKSSSPKPPPPPGRPPKSNKKSPPPPPPGRAKVASATPPSASTTTSATRRREDATEAATEAVALPPVVQIKSPVRKKARRRDSVITIKAPTVLRDVQAAYIKDRALGEGMYGEVFIGKDRSDGSMAALKLIKTEQEVNGFPITTLREVKILKNLQHPNIVHLKEIVVSKEQKEGTSFPEKVFMAFELCEYDLVGLMETPEIRLSQDHIKSWSYQLLKGTHFMHRQGIIHRDLKLANILVNSRGELKIADWGLARSWNSEMKNLTNPVITLWYRPPELLLGTRAYSPKIDLWSVGCIIAEMFCRRPGFLHAPEENQMTKEVFKVCGTPTEESWPGIGEMCPLWEKYSNDPVMPSRLGERLRQGVPSVAQKWLTDHAIDLISGLMEVNPHKRLDAEQALDGEWFFQIPMKKAAKDLSMNFSVKSVHEKDVRDRKEARRAQLSAQRLMS